MASLVTALRLCKRKDFSFHHALSFKVAGALRHLETLEKPAATSAVDWKAHRDELGIHLGGETIQERKMTVLTVPRAGKEALTRQVNRGDTVSWQFQVETLDIKYRVTFRLDEKSPEEVVEPIATAEAGEFVEGFYTAIRKGIVAIEFDNAHSKFNEKRVHVFVSHAE